MELLQQLVTVLIAFLNSFNCNCIVLLHEEMRVLHTTVNCGCTVCLYGLLGCGFGCGSFD